MYFLVFQCFCTPEMRIDYNILIYIFFVHLFNHKLSVMLPCVRLQLADRPILYFTHFCCSLSQLPKMSMDDVMNTIPVPTKAGLFLFLLLWSGTGLYLSRVVTPDVWRSALVLVSPVLRVLWLVDCTVGYGGAVHCLLLRVLCKIHTQATCMSSSTEAAPSMMTIKGLVCRKKNIDLYIKKKK